MGLDVVPSVGPAATEELPPEAGADGAAFPSAAGALFCATSAGAGAAEPPAPAPTSAAPAATVSLPALEELSACCCVFAAPFPATAAAEPASEPALAEDAPPAATVAWLPAGGGADLAEESARGDDGNCHRQDADGEDPGLLSVHSRLRSAPADNRNLPLELDLLRNWHKLAPIL